MAFQQLYVNLVSFVLFYNFPVHNFMRTIKSYLFNLVLFARWVYVLAYIIMFIELYMHWKPVSATLMCWDEDSVDHAGSLDENEIWLKGTFQVFHL